MGPFYHNLKASWIKVWNLSPKAKGSHMEGDKRGRQITIAALINWQTELLQVPAEMCLYPE